MEQIILDIYGREETFLEQVAHDLDDGAAWFNPDEFGRFHDINGSKILSVFAGDNRTQKLDIRLNSNENPEGVYKSRGVLFVRAQEIEGVNANQPLRLDGRLYTVAEARLLQDQVWRIVLEANES
ncbi:MAG: hypothetical protein IJR68_11695 [Fretibacterium sp.]|nr:hypothetical protein [Fretibacterium sp.]